MFVPRNSSGEKKAVLIFIHGGNYQYEGSNSVVIDGRRITRYGDVITITIDYRIGIKQIYSYSSCIPMYVAWFS